MKIIKRVMLACLVDFASVHAERMETGEDSPLLQQATLAPNFASKGRPVPDRFGRGRDDAHVRLDRLVELLEDPALALTQEQQVKLSALLQDSFKHLAPATYRLVELLEDPALALTQKHKVKLSGPAGRGRQTRGRGRHGRGRQTRGRGRQTEPLARLAEENQVELLEDPALALTQEQQVKLSALLQDSFKHLGWTYRLVELLEDPALALTQEQQVKLSALLQDSFWGAFHRRDRDDSAQNLDHRLVELLEDPAMALTQEQQVKLSALLQDSFKHLSPARVARLVEENQVELLEDPALALTQEQQAKLPAALH